MSDINFNKIIFKTASITLGCLLLVFVLLIGSLTLFNPSSLARLTSSLGLNNLSIYYYELSYNKTEDVNDLYNLLNKTIIIKDEQKIVNNFELLYNDGSQEYFNFIAYINEFNLSGTTNTTLEMYLANEDARLKSRYIVALYRLEEKEKALHFAFNDFLNESFSTIEDFNKINFIISAYVQQLLADNVNSESYEVFNQYNSGEFSNFSFFDHCLGYYNNIKNIYISAYDEFAIGQEALEQKVVANNLIKIANTLLVFNNKLQKGLDTAAISADIQSYIVHINALNN